MTHVICHFEIPADDVEALVGFYSELFGWQIEKMPGPMDYWMVSTDPDDESALGGGITERQHPRQPPMNYVLVEDVAAHAARAKELGAQVVVDKTEIPGIGSFAIILDPQHNWIGIFQEK